MIRPARYTFLGLAILLAVAAVVGIGLRRGDRSSVRAEVAPGGLLLVPVRLGSHDGLHVLDTGTNLSLVSEGMASKLGSIEPAARTLEGAEPRRIPEVAVGGIGLASATLRYPEIMGVVDLSALESHLGRSVDGIVGWDVLRQLVVGIDAPEGCLVAGRQIEADEALRRLGSHGPIAALDMEIVGDRPAVVAGVEGEPLRLLLDTGSGGTTIYGFAWRRLGRTTSPDDAQRRSWKVTGETVGREARLPLLQLGPHRLSEIPVRVVEIPPDDPARSLDGLLGMNVLSRFLVVLDGPARRLWLAARGDGPAPAPMTGER